MGAGEYEGSTEERSTFGAFAQNTDTRRLLARRKLGVEVGRGCLASVGPFHIDELCLHISSVACFKYALFSSSFRPVTPTTPNDQDGLRGKGPQRKL